MSRKVIERMLNGRFLGQVAIFSVLLLFLLAGRFSLRWEDYGRGGSELAMSLVFRLPAPTVVANGGAQPQKPWPEVFSQAVHRAFVRQYAEQSVRNEVTWESFLLRLPALVRLEMENDENGAEIQSGIENR